MLSDFLGYALSTVLAAIVATPAHHDVVRSPFQLPDTYRETRRFQPEVDTWPLQHWSWTSLNRPSRRDIRGEALAREHRREGLLKDSQLPKVVKKAKGTPRLTTGLTPPPLVRTVRRIDTRVSARQTRQQALRQHRSKRTESRFTTLVPRMMETTKANTQHTKAVTQLRPWDHLRGSRHATVSLIEYTDLQCAFCRDFHPTLAQVFAEYDDVNWVYRPFPLPFHKHAQTAALAVECAYEQAGDSGVWQFIDMVFEHGVGDSEQLTDYAKEFGWDQVTFQECVETEHYADVVADQRSSGEEEGITGTPHTYVVNHETGESVVLEGLQGYWEVKAAVEKVLKH